MQDGIEALHPEANEAAELSGSIDAQTDHITYNEGSKLPEKVLEFDV